MTEVVEGVVVVDQVSNRLLVRPEPDEVDGSYLITDIDAPAWARR